MGLSDKSMDHAARLRRLHYRAWHRGTQEADLMIGGYYDRYGADWDEEQIRWFERLLEEQDVDIMAWALGTQHAPDRFSGEMMSTLQSLDYIRHLK
jgi:antitoxin CptB